MLNLQLLLQYSSHANYKLGWRVQYCLTMQMTSTEFLYLNRDGFDLWFGLELIDLFLRLEIKSV